MNREIKFRFWNTVRNEWCRPLHELSLVEISEKGWCLQNTLGKHTHKHIINQFTGFLDRNGKEIYEGDIVLYSTIGASTDPKKVGLKEYAEFKWNDENKRIDLWVHDHKGKDSNFFEELDETICLLEVIGNIYQNKELIDDE